jgi:hypothetical protein
MRGEVIFVILASAAMGSQSVWEKKWKVSENTVTIDYQSGDKERVAWFTFVPLFINQWTEYIPDDFIPVKNTMEIQFLDAFFVGDDRNGDNDVSKPTLMWKKNGWVEFIVVEYRRYSGGPAITFDSMLRHSRAGERILFLVHAFIPSRLLGTRRHFHLEKMSDAEEFLVNFGTTSH